MQSASGQVPVDVSAATTQGGVGVILALNGGAQQSYRIVSPPQHGEASVAGASAAYTPNPRFSGTDVFTYAIVLRGGALSPTATVTIRVQPMPAHPVAPPGLKIAGNQLVAEGGGAPFLIKGLIMRPLIAPFYMVAEPFTQFNRTELAAAHAWGANTVRLLVNQSALDPLDPFYSRQFVLGVANAAQQVLDSGFVLIIGVNDEIASGEGLRQCLPTAATQRAWKTLLGLPVLRPQYRSNVLLELFNEPVSADVEAYWWQIWQNGGTVTEFAVGPYGGCAGGPTVGMNRLIAQIRRAGVKNIVVADGLGWAHWLDPLFPLVDPLKQLAYAAHPFLENWPGFTLVGNPMLDWPVLDAAFGAMQSRGPVIATAVGGGSADGNCHANVPLVMPELLDYLRVRSMGAVAWVFDMPPHALTIDWTYAPTSYTGLQCPQGPTPGQGGPGELFQQWFQSQD